MVEYFTQLIANINSLAGGNEFVGGVIVTALITTAVYLSRHLPQWIFHFLKRHFTTSMTLNNTSYSKKVFIARLNRFLSKRINESLSRTLSYDGSHYIPDPSYEGDDSEKDTEIGLGYGIHFFFHNKKLFWIEKTRLESSGSENQKEEITLHTIGRSHKHLKNFVKTVEPEPRQDTIRIYSYDKSDWAYYGEIQKRPLDTVALNNKDKTFITDSIDHFINNREWYLNNGLPHKIAMLLDGKPGSGKTSLVKAIASHYNFSIYIINLSVMSDEKLSHAMSSVPSNSIILMEDFDACSATKNRTQVQESNSMEFGMEMLTLSGILNSLDGVVPLDRCVVAMTTNHKELIDEAIYRNGRVDLSVSINELTPSLIREYTQKAFPYEDLSGYEFIKETMGCNLHQALLVSRGYFDRYIDKLKSDGICKDKGHFSKNEISELNH